MRNSGGDMLKITDTILRDAHQSLIATRLRYDEFEPILEELDNIGYHSLEMWGGATFDSCLRFLDEDPWERLKKIRKKVKNTKLQMLLRGQNILGYKHYADDVVIEFVKRAVYNGIDIIRIFDALNDPRNIRVALETTKSEKAHAQAAISYTISPVHTTENFIKLAKEFENMGADSICIKDMAGLLTPYVAYDLVSELKKSVKVPIIVHSHMTSGLASMVYLKAIEAGADVVDTAISSFSMGTSQPSTEAIVKTLENTEYDTKLDLDKIVKVSKFFYPIREKYINNKILKPKVLEVNINTLKYQVPGGMLSNLVNQLEAQNALNKLDDVLEEVKRVREDFGYPPLVTPTSQIVGTQAVFNVISNERYKMISNETKAYVKGMYGKPTVEMKEDFVKKIIGDSEVISSRPADLIEPQLESIKEEIKVYSENMEDVLSYALFPQVSRSFFKNRLIKKTKVDPDLAIEDNTYPL